MAREKWLKMLGMDEMYTVTREQFIADPDAVFDKVSSGCSPILITADGKPDLLMFSWEDYKRRFALLYTPEEIRRIEEEFAKHEEET